LFRYRTRRLLVIAAFALLGGAGHLGDPSHLVSALTSSFGHGGSALHIRVAGNPVVGPGPCASTRFTL
jgi:hypothetical protein